MSGMLSSQALVVATAMAVSAGTLILLDLLWEKSSPTHTILGSQDSIPEKQTSIPRSCLSSGSKKKKKKVKFADDVKDSSGNGEEYRKEILKKVSRIPKSSCGTEILEFPRMPANRRALYSGKLKDHRVQRMEYSY